MSCDAFQQKTTTRLRLINIFFICNNNQNKFTRGCNRKFKKMYLTMTVDGKKTVTFYERILMNK